GVDVLLRPRPKWNHADRVLVVAVADPAKAGVPDVFAFAVARNIQTHGRGRGELVERVRVRLDLRTPGVAAVGGLLGVKRGALLVAAEAEDVSQPIDTRRRAGVAPEPGAAA